MHSWPFSHDLITQLTLSADQRFSVPDYSNDQTWALHLRHGDPPAITLHTTYGLRALAMSLSPRFLKDELDLIDPAQFHTPPQILAAYPNLVILTFKPFDNLSVTLECWVPNSQVIAGRMSFSNQGGTAQDFTFELIGTLQPLEPGQRLAVVTSGSSTILQGRSGELSPVCFMTGDPFPGIGPYAGLAQRVNLAPQQDQRLTWALASTAHETQSLQLAKQTTARAWDEELARIELVNQAQSIQVETGDPAWDACFALAQRTAYSLFLPATPHLPHPSFVLSRSPDQGYSPRGDGSDYPYLWNGQTALDAYYLNSLILPGGLELAEGVLRNFISVQEESGEIDWKPGLAGQRTRKLAQPLLAALAWQIYQINQNDHWLEEVFPPLLKFLKSWFSPLHDRDQDGMPEWDHPLQTGFPSAPIYNRWQPHAQGVEISLLECPSLAAFLYQDCQYLQKIAVRLQQTQELPWLAEKARFLRETLDDLWNARSKTYRYRDYDTLNSNKGTILRTIKGRGQIKLSRNFKTPQRLQLHLQLAEGETRPLRITIMGQGPRGPVNERIGFAQLYWQNGVASCTTTNTFLQLEEVDIQGLTPNDQGTLATIDYTQEDLSQLAPLWAGVPQPQQAQTLIEKTLLARYLKKFGLAATPQSSKSKEELWKSAVHLPWNHLMGEALLAGNYPKQAANLITRLMKAQAQILTRQHYFGETYHAESGEASGEPNILSGLPPFGLFLQVLGIQRLSPHEIIVAGPHHFSKPVTIRYQTLAITRHKKETTITLLSGESLTLRGPGPHRVQIE